MARLFEDQDVADNMFTFWVENFPNGDLPAADDLYEGAHEVSLKNILVTPRGHPRCWRVAL